jgi:hypothetical protein
MACGGPRGGGNKHASLGEVCEREEIARDIQLTACLQRLEEQVDRFGDQIGAQIKALTEQFASMGDGNGCPCQLNPHYVEEDNAFSIEDA